MSERPMTFSYATEDNRLAFAQHIFDKYYSSNISEQDRVRTQMIASIQSSLGQAYAQGCAKIEKR